MTPTLFPHQDAGADWLADRTRAILAWEPRVGKTCCALEAARRVSPDAPILVVCPAVARLVWKDECARWRPDLTVSVQEHRGDFRWPKSGELRVTSFELTPNRADGPQEGTIVITDECHRASSTSNTSQRVCDISWAVLNSGGHSWPMTGTLIKCHPTACWHTVGMIQSSRLVFGDYGQFLKCFGAVEGPYGKHKFTGADDTVPVRLARVMHRLTRAEVFPSKGRMVQVVRVPLSGDARRLSDAALRAIRARGMSLQDAYEEASRRKKAGFTELAQARSAIAAAKIPALVELVEDYEAANEPLVVGSCSRAPIDALSTRAQWGAICGDTSQRRREDVVRDFRDGRLRGVAATSQSAGVALDLSRAAHIILSDLSWQPGENDQLADRIEGPRQTRATHCLILVADHPIEAGLLENLARKEAIIEKAMATV